MTRVAAASGYGGHDTKKQCCIKVGVIDSAPLGPYVK